MYSSDYITVFFCSAWLLLMLFVIRPAQIQGPKTPSLIRSTNDVKIVEWDPSAESQGRRNQLTLDATNVSPTREPLISPSLSSAVRPEQSQVDPHTDLAGASPDSPPQSPELSQPIHEASQWPNVGDYSPNLLRPVRKQPPPLASLDALNTASNTDTSEADQNSTPASVYSAMPLPGTRFRIELRLPDQNDGQSTTTSPQELSRLPKLVTSSLSAPATAPYQYPNPSAYTRPPFSSSPLTKSFVPTHSSNLDIRRNPLRNSDRWIPGRRLGLPPSPMSGPMMPRPRSLTAGPASRPLVDKYGMRATITSKAFKDLRDINRERTRPS